MVSKKRDGKEEVENGWRDESMVSCRKSEKEVEKWDERKEEKYCRGVFTKGWGLFGRQVISQMTRIWPPGRGWTKMGGFWGLYLETYLPPASSQRMKIFEVKRRRHWRSCLAWGPPPFPDPRSIIILGFFFFLKICVNEGMYFIRDTIALAKIKIAKPLSWTI